MEAKIYYLTPDFFFEDDSWCGAVLEKEAKQLHINKKSIQYINAGGIDSFGEYKTGEQNAQVRNY